MRFILDGSRLLKLEPEEKYAEYVKQMTYLASTACDLSAKTAGRKNPSNREFHASVFFGAIGMTGMDILKIIPRIPPKEPEGDFDYWNMVSLSGLTRVMMDAYYSLFYLAIDEMDNDEEEFRNLVREYHGESKRLSLLNRIRSKPDDDMTFLKSYVGQGRESIESHKSFLRMKEKNSNRAQRILDGKEGMILTRTEIASRAGISEISHRSAYDYLSQYVHLYPLALKQLQTIRPDRHESIRVFVTALSHAVSYMAFSLRDFSILFSEPLDRELIKLIQFWSHIAKEFQGFVPLENDESK